MERTLRGVSLLVDRGVPVKLNSLLMDINLVESQSLVALAHSLGLPHEQFVKISPDDQGVAKAAQHQLARDEMTRLYAMNLTSCGHKTAANERTCQVGMGSCLISHDGIVYPCIELRTPLGDLRRQLLAEIWRDSPMLQQLRRFHTRAHLHTCQTCALADYCEGRCAGLAFKESGDWLASDSLACRQAQAHFAFLHPGRDIPAPSRPIGSDALSGGATVGHQPRRRSQPITLTV